MLRNPYSNKTLIPKPKKDTTKIAESAGSNINVYISVEKKLI